MKMKKTDIGVVVFMYAFCAFFYAYSSKLNAGSKTYPLFTITLLFGLTTLYLFQMILAARKYGVESGVDTVFAGFKALQFTLSLVLTIVYFFLVVIFASIPKLPIRDCICLGNSSPDKTNSR